MAGYAKMKVEGLDEIERLMKELPRRNQRKIQLGALRAGSRIIVKEQRKFIDKIPDNQLRKSGKDRLKRSVGTVTSKTTRHESMVYTGPRYSGVKNTAPDAHLIEFGTDDRYTKDGQYRGRQEATPFIRPAWDAKKVEAVQKVREELLERTINEAKKLSKR